MNIQLARSDVFIEDEQRKEINASLISSRHLRDRFKDKLQSDQILSFLTNPAIDSFDPDLAEQLSKDTVPFKELGTPPFVRLGQVPFVSDRFISLQKWEGIVTQINSDSFHAKLKDMTDKNPDEEAEFLFEELDSEDKEIVALGAIFYWNIGYLDSRTGQRKRESIIRFRRLPAWSKQELESSKREATRVRHIINWK